MMELKYHILYKGQLAVKKLTMVGARRLKLKLMKEKGWAEADIKIVLAEPETGVATKGGNS